MAADDSDSSSLSSAASDKEIAKLAPIFTKAKGATKIRFPPPQLSPPRPKRPPSPPHEEVFADNPDIAFIVMFRSRFNEALPSKLSNFGPQDIERGVTDQPPSPQVESLLCALLALVLNRKKPVERGHHGRALEEAVLSQKLQWPHSWQGTNPLHGNRDFNVMSPSERLNLLRTLIMWSLSSSEPVQTVLKEKYKQTRHSDDENQPLSVQPWGSDGDKRRYFLVQGLDDTNFRVYREASRYTRNAQWYSVAGDIDELKALATKLQDVDGTQAARRLGMRITNAIPTFEASEEKRRRREYRQIRQAAFSRPEPGFGMYEGRTRGKRLRYTYDDDDQDFDSDATSTRRSTRNQSSRNTPMETGPMYTASGRQIRQPRKGDYGESLLSHGAENAMDELSPDYVGDNGVDADDEGDKLVRDSGRATRSSGRSAVREANNPRKRKHIDDYNSIDDMSDEDAAPSGDEWDSDKNEVEDDDIPDADDEVDEVSEDNADEDDDEPDSLIVKLRVPVKALEQQERPIAVESAANGAQELKVEPTTDAPTTIYSAQGGESSAFGTGAQRARPTPPGPPALPNGYAAARQQAPATVQQSLLSTPPSAASAYPTPASSSFSAADVHPVVALPSVQAIHSQQNGDNTS